MSEKDETVSKERLNRETCQVYKFFSERREIDRVKVRAPKTEIHIQSIEKGERKKN